MTSAAPCIASCPQHGELHEPAGADGLSSEFAEEVGRDGNHGHRGPWAGRDESRAFLDPRIARTAGILPIRWSASRANSCPFLERSPNCLLAFAATFSASFRASAIH